MNSAPLLAWRAVHVTERRTAVGFAEMVRRLVKVVHGEAEEVVSVLDDPDAHTLASPDEAFPPERARRIAEELEIHHTPKRGNGPSLAEVELSVLARQCLDRRIELAEALRRGVAAWEGVRNGPGVEVELQSTTADAWIKRHRRDPATQSRRTTRRVDQPGFWAIDWASGMGVVTEAG
ncbi:hypothetical protein [Tautonia plasticadhaerens]|uniref:Transposase n=1 Tax=Tautonia plasticadhaerens TaxID=2527974 RepID=A0A518HA65_9BACT|nr:hypothetical protein [Tautonia plasticadhaerens]QDV37743.1 hypothetical protein ElP_56890 [Tautonia plasticadhaerens]